MTRFSISGEVDRVVLKSMNKHRFFFRGSHILNRFFPYSFLLSICKMQDKFDVISLEFQMPYFPLIYEIGFAQCIPTFFMLKRCHLQLKRVALLSVTAEVVLCSLHLLCNFCSGLAFFFLKIWSKFETLNWFVKERKICLWFE